MQCKEVEHSDHQWGGNATNKKQQCVKGNKYYMGKEVGNCVAGGNYWCLLWKQITKLILLKSPTQKDTENTIIKYWWF